MVVTDCFVGLEKMTADNVRDTLIAERNIDGNFAGNAIDQLKTIAGLCNAAEFDAQTRKLPLDQRKVHGDATDTAILRFSEYLGPISEMKRCWHTKFDLAFNSKNKFMIRVLSLAVSGITQPICPGSSAQIGFCNKAPRVKIPKCLGSNDSETACIC